MQRTLHPVSAVARSAVIALAVGQAQVPAAGAGATCHIHCLHVALAEAFVVIGVVQLQGNTVDAGMGAGGGQQQGARQYATIDESHGDYSRGWECRCCSRR
ncbi:hypothetical protein D3C81_1022340 [compost metagenome]